jgi:uncharacterized FlaG/YvyC family protein
MRIDPVQVVASASQAEALPRDSKPRKSAEESRQIEKASPNAMIRAPKQMSVSMDGDHNIIYQFLDARTGEVVQQVPPEQVLQVMRSIAEQLREAEQKLNIEG